MSKTAAKAHRKKTTRRPETRPITSDRSIYIGFIIIGAAIVTIVFLLTEGGTSGEVALGYLVAMALLVNLYAIRAYRGARMVGWQKALARLPLRFAGFGSRHGKPLEAAHGAAKARTTIIISVIISLVILAVLAYLLIGELRSALNP
jgi:hypothetical protein